uniref:protein-tyrosine-phosphatase n=1 Tax=Candidatus Kentrum sp. FM TaxID=2126340 RepID=A0A450WTG0_9GAMM|nr:MAG: protein-tyrosine phosphatase [Candidatus Kentron sp. FM]VFK20300.1 MAG: protein-tyrosine phosphatase [Candidatus Kentron sp. FM]
MTFAYDSKPKILFVCLGNICRSPAAEEIMRSLAGQHHLAEKIICDSAGIIDLQVGLPPDSRMQYHARQRGYRLSGVARQFDPAVDFDRFDYIVTMDKMVESDIRSLTADAGHLSSIHAMADFCRTIHAREVPDPYRGTGDDFERALDILEDACLGFFEYITQRGNLSGSVR